MKKIISLLFALIIILYSSAEASSIMYTNANPNYPIWMTGNRGGCALDLTSSVEMPIGYQYIQFCSLNYSLWYERGDGETYEYGKLEPDGYIYFREYKDGRGLFYALSDVPTNDLEWKKVELDSVFDYKINDVYYLVKERVKNK